VKNFSAFSISARIAMQALLTLLALGASGMELTPDTWDEATAGKTVFIKFLAPW
jgi:hypothetical protein